MVDDRPYIVERSGLNGRIKLGPEAKYWAEQHGMTLREMAHYLLQQDEAQQEDGVLPMQHGGRADDDLRYEQFPASPNVEDARETDPYLQPPGERGWWNARKPEYGVDPQLIFEHESRNQPSPLGNELGYASIGNSPPQAPYSGPAPLAPPPSVVRRRGVDELMGEARYPWLSFQAQHYLRTRP
jgi:hypothetical protein